MKTHRLYLPVIWLVLSLAPRVALYADNSVTLGPYTWGYNGNGSYTVGPIKLTPTVAGGQLSVGYDASSSSQAPQIICLAPGSEGPFSVNTNYGMGAVVIAQSVTGTYEFWLSWGGNHGEHATITFNGNTVTVGGGSQTTLPQRELKWTVTNSNPPPPTAANLQTWAVFQFENGQPTGVAFAQQTVEAGQSATLTIYVTADDPYSYAPARVDYPASIATYGGFPQLMHAYGLNADGSINRNDELFTYLDGVVPISSSIGNSGTYQSATPITSIPAGTKAPGANNMPPVVPTPAPASGGASTVAAGPGGSSTATDAGTAAAAKQSADAIIKAVNNTGNATRQAADRTTAAVISKGDGLIAAIAAGNQAAANARQSEANARDTVANESGESGTQSYLANRDAALATKDSQAGGLFGGLRSGFDEHKWEVTFPETPPAESAWEIGQGKFKFSFNVLTNQWIAAKAPFLHWLVDLLRLSMMWTAQIAFYRWVVGEIKENAVMFMHTPSPPPTVTEGIASSNPFTAAFAKVGAMVSSLFLAALILSSLSTITTIFGSAASISNLLDGIQNRTGEISQAFVNGAAGMNEHLGVIVGFVNYFYPIPALMGIFVNYIIIETGLVATMPVLVFAMRIRRW